MEKYLKRKEEKIKNNSIEHNAQTVTKMTHNVPNLWNIPEWRPPTGNLSPNDTTFVYEQNRIFPDDLDRRFEIKSANWTLPTGTFLQNTGNTPLPLFHYESPDLLHFMTPAPIAYGMTMDVDLADQRFAPTTETGVPLQMNQQDVPPESSTWNWGGFNNPLIRPPDIRKPYFGIAQEHYNRLTGQNTLANNSPSQQGNGSVSTPSAPPTPPAPSLSSSSGSGTGGPGHTPAAPSSGLTMHTVIGTLTAPPPPGSAPPVVSSPLVKLAMTMQQKKAAAAASTLPPTPTPAQILNTATTVAGVTTAVVSPLMPAAQALVAASTRSSTPPPSTTGVPSSVTSIVANRKFWYTPPTDLEIIDFLDSRQSALTGTFSNDTDELAALNAARDELWKFRTDMGHRDATSYTTLDDKQHLSVQKALIDFRNGDKSVQDINNGTIGDYADDTQAFDNIDFMSYDTLINFMFSLYDSAIADVKNRMQAKAAGVLSPSNSYSFIPSRVVSTWNLSPKQLETLNKRAEQTSGNAENVSKYLQDVSDSKELDMAYRAQKLVALGRSVINHTWNETQKLTLAQSILDLSVWSNDYKAAIQSAKIAEYLSILGATGSIIESNIWYNDFSETGQQDMVSGLNEVVKTVRGVTVPLNGTTLDQATVNAMIGDLEVTYKWNKTQLQSLETILKSYTI